MKCFRLAVLAFVFLGCGLMTAGCESMSGKAESKADRAENRAERRVDQHTDRAIDRTVDKAMDRIFR